jgi:hypothetical protein
MQHELYRKAGQAAMSRNGVPMPLWAWDIPVYPLLVQITVARMGVVFALSSIAWETTAFTRLVGH